MRNTYNQIFKDEAVALALDLLAFEIDFNFVVFNTYLRGDEIIIH